MNRRRIAATVLALVALWFVGGIVMFQLSAPINRCDRGLAEFCDKFGAPRTKDEFERYEIWSTVGIIGGVLLIPAGWWWKRSKGNDLDAPT
jgi:hypothetical protein